MPLPVRLPPATLGEEESLEKFKISEKGEKVKTGERGETFY